jgi:uncharacterized membrane protein HdeD (DUF308 family)
VRTARSRPGPFDAPPRARIWLSFALAGGAMMLLGLLAATNLFVAGMAATYSIGAVMIAAGVIQIAHSAAVRSWTWAAIWLIAGLLYLAAAFAVFYDPLFGATFLTLLLTASLAASGVLRLAVATSERQHGRGWIVFSGATSIVAAIAIGAAWPGNSFWILGLVLALDLAIQGSSLLFFGIALRTARL